MNMTPLLGFYASPFLNYSLGLVVGFAIGAVVFGAALLAGEWLSKKRLEAELARLPLREPNRKR